MSPLTPILTGWYRDPRNYRELVTKEPVLCTVILTLSSRYHLRHGDAWVSRSFFLHNRLWRYCDSLLQRVFWGQEKGLVSSTRSLGTIEGLLLMAEWHARSLHLPPDTEAWDSDYEESEQANGGVNHSKQTGWHFELTPNMINSTKEMARRRRRAHGTVSAYVLVSCPDFCCSAGRWYL